MPTTVAAGAAYVPVGQSFTTTTVKWPPAPRPLSDDDIDRIAKRLAALLKEQP